VPSRAQATRILVGIAVSGGLLYLVLRNISAEAILSHLRRTQWSWLLLSAAFHVATVWARGLRWRPLFHPLSQPAGPLVSATMIGYMANNVLPLRGGELARGYLAARSGGLSFWTAMATLAVERVLDALSILLILGAVVLVVKVPAWLETGALTLLALDLLAMALLILLARQRTGGAAQDDPRAWQRWLRRIPGVGDRLLGWIALFSLGLQSLRPGPHLRPLLGWTAVVWTLTAGAVWAALRSGGLALPFSASLAVLAFGGIGVSLPSAPGYIGTLQFFVVQALAIYGVPPAEAVSVAFLYHAASYIPVTLLGWLLLVVQGVSLWEATREARARTTGHDRV
jgi:uncharacterized protein (TIRG00374 family)